MFDLTIDDRVARLTLNRPEARNAIPQAGWRDLAQILDGVAGRRARVLILDAAGPAFSAGADLRDLALLEGNAAGAAAFREAMRSGMAALRDLPIPSIAAIDGGCFGAAVALILSCDIRIAGADAAFATPPAKLGITYPYADVSALVAQVGQGHAARMLYGGIVIDTAEAARIGLIEERADDAGDAAGRLARAIADNAPSSVAGLKAMVVRRGAPGDDATDALFDRSFASADFAEGMAARRDKRPPRFG